jgi:uncharacterized sulfatase
MRSQVALPADVKVWTQLLREAGYHATNNRKQDYNLAVTPPGAWDQSSDSAHYRARKTPSQPFFAVFNFTTTHEGQIRMPEAERATRQATLRPEERHDPDATPPPPYHPNHPDVRRDWARHADDITLLDRQVGAVLADLDAAGLADRTIVFFFSDHGAGMPRSCRSPGSWGQAAAFSPGSWGQPIARVMGPVAGDRPRFSPGSWGQPIARVMGPPVTCNAG